MHDQLAYYSFFGFPSEWLRDRYLLYAERFPVGGVVLDVGTGRGEFLELLSERGVNGVGIDTDASMVAAAREKGLEAEQADAVSYLQANPEAFDGIFAAHIVEHLTQERLASLMQAAAQALRPGGRVIVVSPNPRNLQMVMNDFWIDLQHVRFYHPEIIRFLMHLGGLREIEMGENQRYQVGPELAEAELPPLPGNHAKEPALRELVGGALPHWIVRRLADLEERTNMLTTWAQTLYAPAEYFVTALR